jgi:energy-coupling factor transporter ATP-binding protein EcfA2
MISEGASTILPHGHATGGVMGLLDDILAWSGNLPTWQSDALRRLFHSGALNAQDLTELLAMVKQQHGDGTQAGVQPVPLQRADIPHAGGSETVRLLGLNNLQHVNRFPSGRAVSFEPDRLNVLFGENGAGKSGYARVLKNACRARVRLPVLPDAFDATRPRPVPTTDISFDVDGQAAQQTKWTQGTPADLLLGNITVYDSACGTDYVANAGASDYQPYGLPHLNRLAAAQRQLMDLIVLETQQISLNASAFDALKGPHEIGRMLANIGKDTDVARLRTLATLTPEEVQRVAELKSVLESMNPEPEAHRAELLAQRLDTAATAAQGAQRYVTDRSLDEVHQRLQNQITAQTAWSLAQSRLHQQDSISITPTRADLLPGTGNDVWKALFEAAEKFSTECAYPSHAHMNTDVAAKCVLCQTPLDESASDRMRRFAEYVVSDASKNAEDATQRMKDTMVAVGSANLDPIDAATLEELATSDPALHTIIKDFTVNWKERRDWVQQCVETNNWDTPRPALLEGDALDVRLRTKATALRTQAQDLRKSLDPVAKATLENERAALLLRQALHSKITEIEQYATNATRKHHLEACSAALNPRRVSLKMTELAGTYINDALVTAMNEELKALGYRRKVEPDISTRTDAGRTMVTLKIKNAQDGANQILSEGEQRAMGLALFLAEVRLQNHKSTVVFDDPSTSFDHHHRRHMAARLAALAVDRPVLVLTHDAVFLSEINFAVKRSGQAVAYQTVRWDSHHPGLVSAGLTWETMDAFARLAALEQSVAPLKQHCGDYMDEATEEAVKVAYTRLRGTIERAVREVFMNNTVRPFSDEVSVDSFGAVIGHPQDEWDQVTEIYARCCEVTDAHDTNAAHQLAIPDPSTLEQDITNFKGLLDKAKKRRSAYETARGAQNKARRTPFAQP